MQHDTKNRLLILRRAAASFLFFFAATGAFAQFGAMGTLADARGKIAADLSAALTAPSVNGVTWARDGNSGRIPG